MRVLIVSDAWHPQVNGVVRTYEYLVREMEAAGHATRVIGPDDFPVTWPMPFYPEIRLVLRPYDRLKDMIEEFAPTRIHIATEGPLGWAARKYCLREKKKFSTSYHTQFPDYVAQRFAWLFPPLYKAVYNLAIRIVRRFHKPSTAVMVSTPTLAQQLKNWGFRNDMKLLTRGIDTSVFYPAEKPILQDLPKPVALYVGRIAIEKNLEAFLEMPWDGSKVLVGDGPVLHDLKMKYPNALFTGKKTGKTLADYYRSSDVFVFPSRTDTFGIVLIEALACGLPVAAYNVTGPKDIVTSASLGALDETNLARAANAALAEADPVKCAAHATDNYSWKAAGTQFIEAI